MSDTFVCVLAFSRCLSVRARFSGSSSIAWTGALGSLMCPAPRFDKKENIVRGVLKAVQSREGKIGRHNRN
jgi:hypothetical protein